jgi:hypothetical protein
MIRFRGGRGAHFYVEGTNQKLRGLHGVLEQKFYPAGSTQDAIQKRSKKTFQRGPRVIKRGIKGVPTARKAKNWGKRIDDQIKRMVEYADALAEKKKSARAAILRHWTRSEEDKSCMELLRSLFGQKMPKYPGQNPSLALSTHIFYVCRQEETRRNSNGNST